MKQLTGKAGIEPRSAAPELYASQSCMPYHEDNEALISWRLEIVFTGLAEEGVKSFTVGHGRVGECTSTFLS